MTTKIWNLMYVAGNPAMFSRITACSDNPMRRAEALATADKVVANCPDWRVWVERAGTQQRIFESPVEQAYGAGAQQEGSACAS